MKHTEWNGKTIQEQYFQRSITIGSLTASNGLETHVQNI